MKKFRGTGIAMVTPFHADGTIDFAAYKNLTNYLIDGGVEYLVVLGTTGESATLSKDEKSAVFQIVAEASEGRVPLVAGIGGNSTSEVIKEVKAFNVEGYEAILSVSPFYNKPTQEGIYQHYLEVATHSPLPIIMYNVPGRTGSNMLPETTLRLASHENIIAVKEASGNLEQVMTIIKDRPEGFLVISGDDLLTQPIVGAGGDGVISVVGNVAPQIFSDMVRYGLEGKSKKTLKNHYQLFELTQWLFAEGNPGGAKAALCELGILQEHLRLPLLPVSEPTRKKIKSLVKDLKIKA